MNINWHKDIDIIAAQIYISMNDVGGSLFSTYSPAFIICRLFNDGHSDCCGVVPHFDLRFFVISDVDYAL